MITKEKAVLTGRKADLHFIKVEKRANIFIDLKIYVFFRVFLSFFLSVNYAIEFTHILCQRTKQPVLKSTFESYASCFLTGSKLIKSRITL